jgi:hypothetical protein
MLKRVRAALTFANVISMTALFLALGGGAYALSIPDSSGVFHGCVSRSTGALRVVSSASQCHKLKRHHGKVVNAGELPITWNQQGPRGQTGQTGPAGTVDTSQFYTKSQTDFLFMPLDRITYGQADTSVSGQEIVAWPTLGFEIETDTGGSVGTISLDVTNIGQANINGNAIIGGAGGTFSTSAFGLNPGQTSAAYTTNGPFIDFSVVQSSTDPTSAADVRCLNITSGGVTRAHCWLLSSS